MAKKLKLNHVSDADKIRLGAQVASAKASMTPAQWKKVVHGAHAGGYTVAGVLSGAPEALRPRLQSSLKKEAARSVADAYKPVLADLDTQESRVKAWDSKRADDNKAYGAWLATQNQTLQTDNIAAQTQLATAAKTSRDGLSAAWDTIQQQSKANTAGGVSDPGQSAALAQVGNARTAAETNAQTQYDGAIASLKTGGNSTTETLAAINSSFAASADAARRTDISQALSSIRDDRTKATIQKATDYLTQFSKLKDGEVTKAQNLMDSDIAAQSLGVKEQQLDLDKTKVNHGIHNDNVKNAIAQQNADVAAGKLRLDEGKADLDGDGKLTSKDYDLKKKIDAKYKPGTKGGPSAGDESYSRKLQGYLSSTYTGLVGLHSDYSKDPSKAKQTGHTPDRFRSILAKRGAKNELISLAEDARKNGGKLSAAGRKKARQLGILHPEQINLN